MFFSLPFLQSYCLEITIVCFVFFNLFSAIDSVCVVASSGFGNNVIPNSSIVPYTNFSTLKSQRENCLRYLNRSINSEPNQRKNAKKHFIRSTCSLNDDLDLRDDESLKSLFEQEDMRGEVTSGTKKFFKAISSFPRSKIKRFHKSKQKKTKPDSVTVSLIKSIIESDALLDRVSETDETADPYYEEPKLRYVDGHLESFDDSLSSTDSSSDIEDTSDVSSINVISQGGSIRSKSDDESSNLENDIISKRSKIRFQRNNSSGSKSNDSFDNTNVIHTPYDTESSSDTVTLSDVKVISNYSKREKSPKYLSGFQHNYNRFGLKRSDTPPLSDMDLIVFKENNIIFKETIFSPGAPVKLIVTEPSLDNSDDVDINMANSNQVSDEINKNHDNVQCNTKNKINSEEILCGIRNFDYNIKADDFEFKSTSKNNNSLSQSKSSNITPVAKTDQFNNNAFNNSLNYIDKSVNISENNPFVFPTNFNLPVTTDSNNDPMPLLTKSSDPAQNLSSSDANSFNSPSFCAANKIINNNMNDIFTNNNYYNNAPINTEISLEESSKNNANNLNPVTLLVKSNSDSGLLLKQPETCSSISSVLTPKVPSSRVNQQIDENQVAVVNMLRPGSQSAAANNNIIVTSNVTTSSGLSQPAVSVTKSSQSPAKLNPIPGIIHRRSSDSDLSITPKG